MAVETGLSECIFYQSRRRGEKRIGAVPTPVWGQNYGRRTADQIDQGLDVFGSHHRKIPWENQDGGGSGSDGGPGRLGESLIEGNRWSPTGSRRSPGQVCAARAFRESPRP